MSALDIGRGKKNKCLSSIWISGTTPEEHVLVVMGNYGEPTCIRDLYKIYLSNVFSQQHVAAKTYTKPKLLFFFQSYVSLSDLKLWQSSSSPLSGIFRNLSGVHTL